MIVSTRVVPLTLEHADALLAGDAVFTTRFGMPVAVGYLDFPEVLPAMRDALARGASPEWNSHLIVHEETATVVGFGGFKGPPVAGVVEIGYSVAPAHRRRGHATTAVHLFVGAARDRGVVVVRAHTLAEENPSTRILARAGFVCVGAMVEDEIGDVWRWELRPRP